MVKKLTLFELHLDDARFSNAVGGTPDDAKKMLDGILARDDDVDEYDDLDADRGESSGDDDLDADRGESSGRSIGRTLGGLALLVVLAVGVRTVARRMLAADDEDVVDDAGGDSLSVDLDDRVEA